MAFTPAEMERLRAIEYRPYAERRANPRALREIACRRCGRFMAFSAEYLRDPDGVWTHVDDGTPACVDPAAVWDLPTDEPAPAAPAEASNQEGHHHP